MADGVNLGSAELTLEADLLPLRADLDDAKARVATAVAEMQAMLDTLHGDVDFNVAGMGTLAGLSAMDRGGVSSLEHLAATADLTSALRDHTEATRDLLAAGPGEHGGGHTTTGIYGVRGASAPGSIANPMVVVMEAASRTPLGSLAAAVGNDTISQGDQRTVVATTQGDTTRVAAAGAPGTESQRSATDMAAIASSRGQGTKTVVAGSSSRPEAVPGMTEAKLVAAMAGGDKTKQSSLLGKILAAKGMTGGAEVTPAATPGGKALPVSIQSSDPIVANEQGDATALAMEGILAKLAGKNLGPGEYASSKLAEGYPLFGYRAAMAPDQVLRLYGAGGVPGTKEFGAAPEDPTGEGSPSAADWLLASSGGKGGGGGGGFHLGGGIGPFRWSSGGGGGGGESNLRKILYGSSWLPGAAGLGTLGSFAGFGPEHIILTLGGIAGSGVAALGGGALLAGGAAAKLGAGMGSDFAVGSSAVADTTSLYKAQSALNDAITAFGKDSRQAQEAGDKLKLVYAEIQHTAGVAAEARLATQVENLNTQWDAETSSARVAFVHLAEPLVEIGTKWIPLINTAAEQNFTSMASNLKPFFSYLKGPEAMGIFAQLENQFHEEIPTAMKTLDEGFQFFGKTVSSVAPLTGGLLTDLDHFFTKMDEPAHFAHWEELMAHLIKDFHVWGAFLKEFGGAAVDLFDKDAHTGEGIIETLTKMLHGVREYENSVTGASALHTIFVVHKEETIALLEALSDLARPLTDIYETIAPPLVRAVTTITEDVADMLTDFEKLGPGAEWIVGLTLMLSKLRLLVPLLKEAALSAGLLSGGATGSTKVSDLTVAQAQGLGMVPGGTATHAPATEGVEAVEGAGASDEALTGALLTDAVASAKTALSGAIPGIFTGALASGVASMGLSALGVHKTTNTAASLALGAGVAGSMALGPEVGIPVGLATAGMIEAIHALEQKAPLYGEAFAKAYYAPFAAILPKTVIAPLEEKMAKIRDERQKAEHPEPNLLGKIANLAGKGERAIPIVGQLFPGSEHLIPKTPRFARTRKKKGSWLPNPLSQASRERDKSLLTVSVSPLFRAFSTFLPRHVRRARRPCSNTRRNW